MQINKQKITIKDISMSSFLLVVSGFCSQTFCYFYFDEFIKHFTTSIYTLIIPRFIFAICIYLFFDSIFRGKKITKNRKIILLIMYIVFLLTMTMKPVFFRGYNLKPFMFMEYIKVFPRQMIIVIANLLMYIPIGSSINYFTNLKIWKVILISVLFIVVIECLQYILLLGYFDIDDIMLNTLGIILGYFLFNIFNTIQKKKGNIKQSIRL